ncbi:hypothetical protein AVEN_215330-1 [Araneus ventricosus]|uniref:Uncharacterized protein n=1 Tax=Araneus ventricosus TaxID=182803 RepID=A0A4Y2GDK6_ARAVE|nr:hypothetical protein AVEN_215330-1 [Araneus ventricosus]
MTECAKRKAIEVGFPIFSSTSDIRIDDWFWYETLQMEWNSILVMARLTLARCLFYLHSIRAPNSIHYRVEACSTALQSSEPKRTERIIKRKFDGKLSLRNGRWD